MALVSSAVVSCGGEEGGGESPEQSSDLSTPQGELAPVSLTLLRSFEYENALRDLFGDDFELGEDLADDLVRANFSSVSAARDCFSATAVEARERIALHVAQQVFSDSQNPLAASGCSPSDPGDACFTEFISEFGARALRRPLSDVEVEQFRAVAASTSALFDGDMTKGAEMMVAAIIQSPFFLYRVELGEELQGQDGLRVYTPDEMASRLAFAIWESPPDAELLEAAQKGELQTAESVRAHAERMLADPRADTALQRFWIEHLNIDRLTLTYYPKEQASEDLYAALRAEGHWLAEQATAPGSDALSFLTYSETRVNAESAALYEMDAPTSGYEVAALPDNRRGYLTSGVFLGTQAHTTKTSPVRRGKFILDRLLCSPIPPPPPSVDVSIPEVPEGEATLREQLSIHSESPACFGCHEHMDPLGFAFEHYDNLGAYRTTDNGLPVDASVVYLDEPYADGLGLIPYLTGAEETTKCLTLQTLRHLTGHVFENTEASVVAEAHREFVAAGNDYRLLVSALVSSDAFRFANGTLDELSAAEEGEE